MGAIINLPLFPDPLTAVHGGTGVTSNTAHAVLVGEGTAAVVGVGPDSVTGRPLLGQGTLADPAFGTLGNKYGGTGVDASGVTDGQLLVGQTSDNSLGLAALTGGSDIAITNAGHSITVARKRVRQTITSSATPAINTDITRFFNITALAAAITSMTSGLSGTPTDGDQLVIRIKDDGSPRAITWGASFEADGAALPTTTTASKRLHVGFFYDSVTSKWGCVTAVTEA